MNLWDVAMWLSAFGVIVGVVLEQSKTKRTEQAGFIILVACLASELCCQVIIEFDANSQIADLEGRNLALEVELAPRVLRIPDQTKMTASMTTFGGLHVNFLVYPLDVEARRLAMEIAIPIREANLEVIGIHPMVQIMGQDDSIISGIEVLASDDSHVAGNTFVSLLIQAGLQAKLVNRPVIGSKSLIVYVGLKPISLPNGA